jgi:hypothetical protein
MSHMTQEQALEAAKTMFPDKANGLVVSRERLIGARWCYPNEFRLWDTSAQTRIIATSHRSFEHMLAIAKSGNEDVWEEDNSPVEEVA